MPSVKSPRRDLFIDYWYRRFTLHNTAPTNQFKRTVNKESDDIAGWFIVTRNQTTHMAETERPITCVKGKHKLYT